MDQRTQYLLTAPALPLLTQLSIPSSVAFIVQSTVSLTEVWYVGQLGSTPLAAMALVFPMLMLMQIQAQDVRLALSLFLNPGPSQRLFHRHPLSLPL